MKYGRTDEGLEPCATCPWRMDKDASTIPLYNHEKACALVNTEGRGDAFRRIMACHHSAENSPIACYGYLAQQGESNINVRIMASRGELPPPTLVRAACQSAGIRLHRTYKAVLRKLKRRAA